MSGTPRVRFAPAPSGSLHVGNARTALYSWLHARANGGTCVLRVEDTDTDRVTEAGREAVYGSLDFLGLDFDEGPRVGGPHGPYQQSERRALHDRVVAALVDAGHAYEAYETPEELQAKADEARAEGRPPGYDGAHRDLTPAQRQAFRDEGRRPVIRLRTPDEGALSFHDVVRGDVTVDWERVPDFVLARADGSPTYYLANTVDDLAMGITDVVRGEDLLSAVPRQVLLGRHLEADDLLDTALAAVDMPARPPFVGPITWAHLPMIVGEDRKPLSKRHGSVSVEEFRRQGYLPEALVNQLALCGWSYDGRRERFDLAELVEVFSLQRVGRNPAAFDTDKLRSFNGDRIKELPVDALTARLEPVLVDQGVLPDPVPPRDRQLLERLVPLVQERIQTLAEAAPLIEFAFRDDVAYEEKAAKKWFKGRAGEVLQRAGEVLDELDEWTGDAIMSALDGVAAELELGRGRTFQPVRVAVTGGAVSPPLPETLAELDRGLVVARVRAAAEHVRSGGG